MEVVKALKFILTNAGVVNLTDYMDDFHLVMPSRIGLLIQKKIFVLICEQLGIPLSLHKLLFGKDVEYLGIIIDSEKWCLYLRTEKRLDLLAAVRSFLSRSTATVNEIQSIVGRLIWAAQVYRGGGTFCRGLIHSLKGLPSNAGIHMSTCENLRFDLVWWEHVLQTDSTRTITEDENTPFTCFYTDACLESGGGFWGNNWFYTDWTSWPDYQTTKAPHISLLELLAVLAGIITWGTNWSGHRVICYSDNSATVAVIVSRTSTCQNMMRLLRRLFFLEHLFDFQLICHHIPGVLNIDADLLSRNRIAEFRTRNPTAEYSPSHIPWDLIPGFDEGDIRLAGHIKPFFATAW
jgi:hypothetical protein